MESLNLNRSSSERRAWIFLNHVPLLGPIRFFRLLEAAGSAEAILALDEFQLAAADVSGALTSLWTRTFRDTDCWKRVDREIERSERGEFRIVTGAEADYPASLGNIGGRPPVLYIRGRWPLEETLTLAIVGTRRASSYGLRAAEWLTRPLAESSVRIVSGLAAGIDAAAHRATLDAGGWTVGVLGHGLDWMYPKENRKLFERMRHEGTLISEFPCSAAPEPAKFPQRNRIVSGLSRGVVVVEAGERSGALITARCAAEQGKDVFAVPGPIFSAASAGSHILIKEGAKLVETPDDVLSEYDAVSLLPRLRGKPERAGKTDKSAPPPSSSPSRGEIDLSGLNSVEKLICSSMIAQPLNFDELAEVTRMPVDQLAETLLSLELKNRILSLPGQRYVAKEN